MLRKIMVVLVAGVCFLPSLIAQSHPKPKPVAKVKPLPEQPMPLTTKSVKAKDLYQRAVLDYELMYLDRALIGWRAAAKEDPSFAAAFAMVAMNSHDPEEIRTSRERAKELAPKSSAGEKLMIQWIADTQEGNSLSGVAAMNDLISKFPRDRHIYYLAANWLLGEHGYDQAHHLLHKVLDRDPDYAPALNIVAYVHANNREFDEALASIDHYAKLVPQQPNPEDSYGEILRMSGHFETALDHYRAALNIDPNFNLAQLGIADTYSLLGNQEQARREYDTAVQREPDRANRFDYRMQKAATWIREKNYTEADREFWRVAMEAHEQSYELQEAQALRRMAQYAPDDKPALERLASAEDALTHRNNLSPADRNDELAQILRIRAMRAMHAGKEEVAQAALNQLGELAAASRNRMIQGCWHGAAGEMLLAKGQFQEAIAELGEDADNPATLASLVKAYAEVGKSEQSRAVAERLRTTYLPTLEQALSVEMAGKPAGLPAADLK